MLLLAGTSSIQIFFDEKCAHTANGSAGEGGHDLEDVDDVGGHRSTLWGADIDIRKQFDGVDQHQIIERPGVGNDEPHARSEAEPLQVVTLAFDILKGVWLEHVMCLQKLLELGPRAEPEPPQLRLGQMAEHVFFEGQSFERAAFDLASATEATRPDRPGCKTVISISVT
jgi:hypothetical protein